MSNHLKSAETEFKSVIPLVNSQSSVLSGGTDCCCFLLIHTLKDKPDIKANICLFDFSMFHVLYFQSSIERTQPETNFELGIKTVVHKPRFNSKPAT